MKMVILMYLEDDESCVASLLSRLQVPAYSRLSVEGHGPGGRGGWYGETTPYQSQVLMTFVPDALAASLLKAVSDCTDVQDPRHPIRAAALHVHEFVRCRIDETSTEN